MIPKYINCENKKIEHCNFYMHKECRETCAYAKDIRGLGIGAICNKGLLKKLQILKNIQK